MQPRPQTPRISATGAPARVLVTHGCRAMTGHQEVTHVSLARHLATILGLEFAGAFEDYGGAGPVYHLPRATLVGPEVAARLGLAGEDDLLGGWVPHDFMATKAIVHPLVSPDAAAPEGWSPAFAEHVAAVALPGFTAFSPEDALTAGWILLETGPVQVKPVHADGARGQAVVYTPDELDAAVAALSDRDRLNDILVVEEHLEEVITFSVGQLRLGENTASYCGTQTLTTDNSGATVYGGSELLVVRGDYEALLEQSLAKDVLQAVDCARVFDRLGDELLPGLIASRRNYDVAVGLARDGTRRCGVLEQSWRLGGASGAEIAALEVFQARPDVDSVIARTVERYGPQASPPAEATIHFRGDDPETGPLTKYTVVEARTDARQED